MARYDFWCDPNGVDDLVLSPTGEFRWTQNIQESLTQRLSIRLKTWLGEWQYNTEFGTPYRQRLLTSALSKAQKDAEVMRICLQEADVTNVILVDSKVDPISRMYTVNRVEVYCDNASLVIPIVDSDKRLNNYPEPLSFEDFKLCTFDPNLIEYANTLYKYVNKEGLPRGTYDTWYNVWSADLDTQDIAQVNRIYKFTNIDGLPENTYSSWFNEWK